MIIITSKNETVYLNEKEFATISFDREKGEVVAWDKENTCFTPCKDVLSVRHVTDTSQIDETVKSGELIEMEEKASKARKDANYMRDLYIAASDGISHISEIINDRKLDDYTAFTKIRKIIEESKKKMDDLIEIYNEK